MSPLMKKLVDVATAVALTMGVFFVIVFTNAFLMARGSYWTGINIWLGFIQRPDILGTIILTAAVTFGYTLWQQGNTRR